LVLWFSCEYSVRFAYTHRAAGKFLLLGSQPRGARVAGEKDGDKQAFKLRAGGKSDSVDHIALHAFAASAAAE